MKVFVCIAVLAAFELAASATDYCSPSLCQGGRQHIGCRNNDALGGSCPRGAKYIDVTPYIQDILDKHNSHRNEIASGSNRRYSQAARMATITWNPELAKLASMNVKTCNYQHDACRNTETYQYSGQNMGYSASSGDYPPVKETILGIIDSWYSEEKDGDMSYIKSYRSHIAGKVIGHFTVMVADKNVAVGCGAMTYPKNFGGDIYYAVEITCNYATTNMMNFPIYEAGAAASKCTTGPNPNYRSLCSANEKYEVNKFF